MPVFQAPDFLSLGNGAGVESSSASFQPLMANGHGGLSPDMGRSPQSSPMPDLPEEPPQPSLRFRNRKGGRSWEKILLLLLILALAALVGVVLLHVLSRGSDVREVEVCTSQGCVHAAANLISAVDRSVDPCEDFYAYACGSWNRAHPIPDDMPSFGTFAFVRERVRQQMRVLLESVEASPSRSINMTRLAYRGCMDMESRNGRNSSELTAAMSELGGWPLLGRPNRLRLTELLGRARKEYAHEVFFSIYVYADAKDTDKNVLYIDQGSLALGRGSRDYYLNDTLFGHQLGAYRRFMRSTIGLIASDAGVALSDVSLAPKIEAMVELEKSLAKIMTPEADRRNHSRMYNKWSLEQVAAAVPAINWSLYLDLVLPADVRSLVTAKTPFIACEVEYLRKLNSILELMSANDTLANYVLWRLTQGWVKVLDTRFDDVKQEFLRAMTGQEEKSAKWKECVPQPITWLPLATGALYVQHHFDSRDKAEALEMIGNLREAFSELVGELRWMDPATKATAIDKAGAMLNHIGYPDFIKDTAKLDKYYSQLSIHEGQSYFQLVKAVLVWTQMKELRRLKEPFKKTEFEVSPAIVNAFYSPEKNAITFPAGILQPPFFNGDFPKAINYGAMGAVIGHEITHGFDDQGSQFDRDGNLKDWWSREASEGFAHRKQCIIAQYSSYHVPGTKMNVNGRLTQGENIADNGGVKEAYRAYRKYIAKAGREEPRLPGFADFSNDQIFFLSYAHFWCGHKKREAAIQQILTDEHSPEMYRVIGVLSNLDEFSAAFACPAGSRLNPAPSNNSKCTVW